MLRPLTTLQTTLANQIAACCVVRWPTGAITSIQNSDFQTRFRCSTFNFRFPTFSFQLSNSIQTLTFQLSKSIQMRHVIDVLRMRTDYMHYGNIMKLRTLLPHALSLLLAYSRTAYYKTVVSRATPFTSEECGPRD